MRWLLLITIILTTWPQSGSVCSAADNVTAESLFGKWKLKSVVLNDGEWFIATAGWATVGRTWEFREDGTGDFRTTMTKWEMNSDEGTLKISVLNYWGSWTTPCPGGSIEFDGEDLILEFIDPLKQKNVMTLSPIRSAKKRSSKKTDDINSIVSIEKKIFDKEVFTETIETLPGTQRAVLKRLDNKRRQDQVASLGSRNIVFITELKPKESAKIPDELGSIRYSKRAQFHLYSDELKIKDQEISGVKEMQKGLEKLFGNKK